MRQSDLDEMFKKLPNAGEYSANEYHFILSFQKIEVIFEKMITVIPGLGAFKVWGLSPKCNEGICIYELQKGKQKECLYPYSVNTKCRKIGCNNFKCKASINHQEQKRIK